MGTAETLDIGLVGLEIYGFTRAKVLAEFDQQLYGSDTNPQARREFERQFGGETFERPTDLLEQDLDAVIITIPNRFHEPVAVEALQRGIDVFIEKPLAHTLESATHIAEVATDADCICMVGYWNRFLNVCNILKAYIDRGFFGEITHIRAEYLRRRGIPRRGSWYTAKAIAGGGVVTDIGVHVIDLLLYFLDAPTIHQVLSTTRRNFIDKNSYTYLDMWGGEADARMFDVEDSATAFLEFATDQTATIDVAWAVNGESTHSYHIRGTKAGAHLDIQDAFNGGVQQKLTFYETKDYGVDHFIDSTIEVNRNDPYRTQMEVFIHAVASGDQLSINTVEQALHVQQIVDRIYERSSNV